MDASYQWVRLTVSGVISPKPVKISCIIVTPHDTKYGKATFYDGESTADPVILELKSFYNSSEEFCFAIPLQTQRGLYCEFVGDTDAIGVQFAVSSD